MRDWISRNRWIGAVLLVAGIAAVVMIRRGQPEPEAIKPIRPLKTMVLGAETTALVEEYPAKVAAGEEVVMAFDRGGTLTELPVKEGDRVKKGQLLAKLDPNAGETGYSSKSAKDGSKGAKVASITTPPLPNPLDLPPSGPPIVPPTPIPPRSSRPCGR